MGIVLDRAEKGFGRAVGADGILTQFAPPQCRPLLHHGQSFGQDTEPVLLAGGGQHRCAGRAATDQHGFEHRAWRHRLLIPLWPPVSARCDRRDGGHELFDHRIDIGKAHPIGDRQGQHARGKVIAHRHRFDQGMVAKPRLHAQVRAEIVAGAHATLGQGSDQGWTVCRQVRRQQQ